MKKIILAFFSILAFSGYSYGCTFSWTHYGSQQVYDRIKENIGSKVTDSFCQKYNKNYAIVIVTDEYTNNLRTLAHVSVALRKRGTNLFPTNRRSAYKFEDGNFVVAYGYDMVANLALETLMDVMSDPGNYTN